MVQTRPNSWSSVVRNCCKMFLSAPLTAAIVAVISILSMQIQATKPSGDSITGGKDQQAAAGYHHHHHGGFGGGGGMGMGMGMGGGGGGGGGDSKYFQYAHNPKYGEYEFGYKRGNDYHHQERYEKYGPGWSFKTKVNYHDKHAHAHGQHYWDYNHGDNHDHYGGSGGGGGGGGDGGGGGGGGGSAGSSSDIVANYDHSRAKILANRNRDYQRVYPAYQARTPGSTLTTPQAYIQH